MFEHSPALKKAGCKRSIAIVIRCNKLSIFRLNILEIQHRAGKRPLTHRSMQPRFTPCRDPYGKRGHQPVIVSFCIFGFLHYRYYSIIYSNYIVYTLRSNVPSSMSVTPCPHLFFIGLKFGPGLYQLPPINITETRIGPVLGLRGSRPSCHCRRDLRPPLRPPEDSPHPSGHLQESPAVCGFPQPCLKWDGL